LVDTYLYSSMYTPVDVCIEIMVDQIENAVYSDYERILRNGVRLTLKKGRNTHGNGDRGIPIGITQNQGVIVQNGPGSLISLRSMVALFVVTTNACLH